MRAAATFAASRSGICRPMHIDVETSNAPQGRMRAVASTMKTLSERRVKRASVVNLKTGTVDDTEEKAFKSDGDAVFGRVADIARELA